MAHIIVLGAKVPFSSGGQDVLMRTLRSEIAARGHEAEIIELPFLASPKANLLNQIALWRSKHIEDLLEEHADLVIATKFPTYFAKHKKKSVWLVHQFREIYDLYGGAFSDISDDPRDEILRREISDADTLALKETRALTAISNNVAIRLKQFNGLNAETLYPPLPLGTRYYNSSPQPYILSVGRLCDIKRVDLMIKAMPLIDAPYVLKIVGSPDRPGIMDYFKNEIAKHGIQSRVEFLGRVDDETLLKVYAESFAVYYAPLQEDYGYVTIEAMASGKPIITAQDSGGVLEFIKHNENGVVCERATSELIAAACNGLIRAPDSAHKLGQTALKQVSDLNISASSWDRIVETLLSPLKV